jgi:predicted AlkP superfamily phosphohydrolase/phosphomutase
MASQLRKWESHYAELSRIDWQQTKAYGYEVLTFPPSIWINLQGARPHGIVSPGAEYDRLVQFIAEQLYTLKDPVTDQQLISRVYPKEEIYRGRYLDQAPYLTLAWWEGTTFLGKPSFTNGRHGPVVMDLRGQPVAGGEWGGSHAAEGMVVFRGTPFKPGVRLERIHIIDLAPALLHLLGLPIPADMDGRVPHEALTEGFAAAGVPAYVAPGADDESDIQARTYSDEEAFKVEERLRELGYIE